MLSGCVRTRVFGGVHRRVLSPRFIVCVQACRRAGVQACRRAGVQACRRAGVQARHRCLYACVCMLSQR